MTDLEIHKLCADALSLEILEDFANWNPPVKGIDVQTQNKIPFRCNPIHDDAQAMALVKKFKLDIEWIDTDTDLWRVEYAHSDESLNRAICKCVAAKQARTNGSDNDLPL